MYSVSARRLLFFDNESHTGAVLFVLFVTDTLAEAQSSKYCSNWNVVRTVSTLKSSKDVIIKRRKTIHPVKAMTTIAVTKGSEISPGRRISTFDDASIRAMAMLIFFAIAMTTIINTTTTTVISTAKTFHASSSFCNSTDQAETLINAHQAPCASGTFNSAVESKRCSQHYETNHQPACTKSTTHN